MSIFCTIFEIRKNIFVIYRVRRKKTRILLLFIFLGIFSISYANDYSVFERGQKKGLKNQRGKELIPPLYEEIGWSDGSTNVIDNVIGYKKDGQWGLITVDNTNITSSDFIDLIPSDKNHIIASVYDSYKLNQLFGTVNYSGKTIIDFKYTSLKKFGENFVVGKKRNNNIFYGIINKKDEIIVPLEYIAVNFIISDIIGLEDQFQSLNLENPTGRSILDFKIEKVEKLGDKFPLSFLLISCVSFYIKIEI